MAGHVVDLMEKIASSLSVPEWVTCPCEVRTLSYRPYLIEALCREVPKTEEPQGRLVVYRQRVQWRSRHQAKHSYQQLQSA